MKKYLAVFSLFMLLFPLGLWASGTTSLFGQHYLFVYFTDKNENRNEILPEMIHFLAEAKPPCCTQ